MKCSRNSYMLSYIFKKLASLILARNNWSFYNDPAESIAPEIGTRTRILPKESKDPNFHVETDLDSSLYFWDYDYVQFFQEKNSLTYGGIPLCVSPSNMDIIKQTDAIYCKEEKCWFWPYRQHGNLNEIHPFLPKVYQMEDNILVPNLVPEPLWGFNLRKYLDKKDWDFLRRHTYAQSGYGCSICGGKGEQWPVECDEVWNYQPLEDGRWVSVLTGLRALCPRCHRVNHLGKANVDGKYNETIRHMAYINGWSLNRTNQVAEDAFKIFEERSTKTWLLGYENESAWDFSVERILKKFFFRC